MGLLDMFGFGKKIFPKEEPFIVGALYKTTKDIMLPIDSEMNFYPKIKVPKGSIIMCASHGYIKDRRANSNHDYIHETIFFFEDRRLALFYLDCDVEEVQQYFDLFCV